MAGFAGGSFFLTAGPVNAALTCKQNFHSYESNEVQSAAQATVEQAITIILHKTASSY